MAAKATKVANDANDSGSSASVHRGMNTLGLQLLAGFGLVKQDATDSKEAVVTNNVFISPLSIHVALTMARHGAAGKTLEEFHAVLADGLGGSPNGLNEYARVLEALRKTGPKVTINIANGLFSRGDLKPEYVSALQTSLSSVAEQLAGDGRAQINSWVDKATSGMIKNLLSGPVLPNVRAVLVNAVYFKGLWANEFKEADTKPAAFKSESKEELRKCKMMNMTVKDTLYKEAADFQSVSLPYGKGRFRTTFVLPRGQGTVASLLKSANADSASFLKKVIPLTKEKKGFVHIPRFRIEFGAVSLKSHLISLGLVGAFQNSANFTAMASDGDIMIDDVIHKAVVEMSEKGTKAAAATAVVMRTKSRPPPDAKPPFDFNANHPFLFLIQDTASSKENAPILFAGTVMDPGDGVFDAKMT